jgi:dTDP-4-amino-4,6-dideoxygalactose transaminase
VVRHPRRDALAAALKRRGVGTLIHFPVPLHLQPAGRRLGYKEGDFPVAEQQAKRIITLPVHQHLSAEQVRYMIDCIIEFYHAR